MAKPGPKPMPVLDRFFSHVDPTGSCWQWTGALHDGYGNFTYDASHRGTRRMRAHRWLWKQLVDAELPDEIDLDHLCRNRGCVNPDHLEPVTRRVNLSRGIGTTDRLTCINGHDFTPENTYTYKASGHRQCRTCRRQRDRQRPNGYQRAKKKEQAA